MRDLRDAVRFPMLGVMANHHRATLREWLREAPFTLAMSSGFFGFFAHCGVLSVLEDEGLPPAAVSGSSAGALVAGVWGAGLTSHALRDELLRVRREDFWDPEFGLGLLRGRLFRSRLEALLPVHTFEQCRVPVTISVFDVLSRATRVISKGALAPAVQASCALPGFFHPAWMDGRPMLDGGIRDRGGLEGVALKARVLFHHLAWRSESQRASVRPRIPVRDGLTALVIRDLPRVGPFRLSRGPNALNAARNATARVLDQPISDGAIIAA